MHLQSIFRVLFVFLVIFSLLYDSEAATHRRQRRRRNRGRLLWRNWERGGRRSMGRSLLSQNVPEGSERSFEGSGRTFEGIERSYEGSGNVYNISNFVDDGGSGSRNWPQGRNEPASRQGKAGKRRGQAGRRRRIRHARARRMEFVRRRLTKFRNQGENFEGKLRLVDGREEWEGNVEIFHDDRWGNICDDEWDLREGEIVCKLLGFPDVLKVTYNAHYGKVRYKYWLDNLFCYGSEIDLTKCRHDGWGIHDCQSDEAAGVVCQPHVTTTTTPPSTTPPQRDEPRPPKKATLAHILPGKIKIRLRGGRVKEEGRVEIKVPIIQSAMTNSSINASSTWGLICGDGWSLLEAMVVCRQLGFKYAQSAPSTGYFGGNSSSILLSGVKCIGHEERIDFCLHDVVKEVNCPGASVNDNIAGVTCVNKMADLVPDHLELARSTHLEDKQLFFLQCAMEENCLASSAYKAQENGYGWHLETRRLLRFTARIVNQGDEVFMPLLPKGHWQWHHCHMHYHSMEVFAHYDIIDANGKHVAEGHKASFCLEDNNCLPGVQPVFKCENYGDQGISPGCTDTYAYNIDCQWVDITDVPPGIYTFKLSVNPELKVGEQNFSNNAAVCNLFYNQTHATINDCSLQQPDLQPSNINSNN